MNHHLIANSSSNLTLKPRQSGSIRVFTSAPAPSKKSVITSMPPKGIIIASMPSPSLRDQIISLLIHQLGSRAIVEQVRAVQDREDDDHSVTFFVQLKDDDLYSRAVHFSLGEPITEAEWYLHRKTGEPWYFGLDIVDSFDSNIHDREVIAVQYVNLKPTSNSSHT